MPVSVDDSFLLAERALTALRAAALAATPRNIELWTTHLEGKNPALSREIDKRERRNGGLKQADADDIYNDFILRADLSQDVIELVQRFETEMSLLTDAIEATGEKTAISSDELQKVSTELKKSAAENPTIGTLVESVIAVTKSVREANRQLETQLAKSSDEVVTLRQNIESVRQEAMTDPLTGMRNRKCFDVAIEELIASSRIKGAPLALIMADVDHFKDFNDRWGHQTGDQVLRLVAEVMNANIKGKDILARYGGEEFAILLPETTLENARMLADRIRRSIEVRRLKKRRTDEDLGAITMSMGVALISDNDTSETLIERADAALFAAKRSGRNAVFGEGDLPAEKTGRRSSAA